MAGIEIPRINDDRIIFPEGTQKGNVKIYCGTCPLNIDCHGYDSKGFAEIDRPRNINRGQSLATYIEENASCIKQ